MPEVHFDKFYRYDQLTDILEAFAREHPRLCKLSSIGKSYEGRDIWLLTLTSFDTGADTEKPALWLDANIHATEVTGSTAALHLIHKLVTEYGSDDKVTRALDTRAFYVVPRLNPDGAELALADRPRFLRSSVRAYPRTDRLDGLHEEDLDGDGRILMMRVPDPNGPWKVSDRDDRLLVFRAPDEYDESETYYRVFYEGAIRNYDGVMIKVAKPLEGLDLNRNFPMEWAVENEQEGAGPFPTSEPEVHAVVQAVVDRPNVTGYITYHTFSAVHLRPYSAHDDEHFPTQDLRVYKHLGKEATKITGYPAVSVFHDFKYEPKQTIKGGADDWAYDHLGVFAWTTEFWSPQREAGLKDYHFIEWIRDHPVEDDLALLEWSDNKLGGRGYVDWYPFDHPQLGKVELGGWDFMYCWSNPPPELLEREIAPHSDFAVFHALVSPKIEFHSVDVQRLDKGVYALRVVVINTGWLPTNVSEKAVERKAVLPVEVELSLPDGARLVAGEPKTEMGQLEGRTYTRSLLWWGADDSTTDRAKADWVVEARDGGTLGIEARHSRAGTVRRDVSLDP
jgi:murein tripeptide amidase MpaA